MQIDPIVAKCDGLSSIFCPPEITKIQHPIYLMKNAYVQKQKFIHTLS